MSKITWIILFLSAFVDFSLQVTSNESTYYVAGVVEYAASENENNQARVEENLEQYVRFIEEAHNKNVDILVFPESTLNGDFKNRTEARALCEYIPDPKKKSAPCETSSQKILRTLSCKAKERKMYTVINLCEMEICSSESQTAAEDSRPCAPDAYNYYNTDVVFDRNGAVIARYRKFNLFGEKLFNTTKTPERVTFDTDFGVRFGLFTCFDILFKEPALGLVHDGVKDLIFPNRWYSEMPFLTAPQIQEYWSYTNDVNLLAAGASDTRRGRGGSGIYAGVTGPLISYMSVPGLDNNKLLVARVLSQGYKYHEETGMDNFYITRDEIDEYTYEKVGERFAKELCSEDLCCMFNVTSEFLNQVPGTDYYHYRAIVGDVTRSFSGIANAGIKSCAIVACSGSDISSCARRFNFSSTVSDLQVFHSIHIEGNFPAIDDVLTMPNTLTRAMRPLPTGSFVYIEDRKDGHETKQVSIDLHGSPIRDLHTFGIFGRDFRKDGI